MTNPYVPPSQVTSSARDRISRSNIFAALVDSVRILFGCFVGLCLGLAFSMGALAFVVPFVYPWDTLVLVVATSAICMAVSATWNSIRFQHRTKYGPMRILGFSAALLVSFATCVALTAIERWISGWVSYALQIQQGTFQFWLIYGTLLAAICLMFVEINAVWTRLAARHRRLNAEPSDATEDRWSVVTDACSTPGPR